MKVASSRRWRIAAAVIAVSAFVLGFAGFVRSMPALHALYNTLSLYTLGFTVPDGTTPGSLPVTLEIARFLAPAATVLAAVQLASSVFREQIDTFVARRQRHHVVVCGLGPVGIATVLRLRTQGRVVVAIERDATCPNIVTARGHGARVVVGDATVRLARSRAAVTDAGWFVWTPSEWLEGDSLADDLRHDLRDARANRSLESHPHDPTPTALIRVRDLALCSMFRRDVLLHAGDDTPIELDTDFFNEAESTAQRLLWRITRGYAAADRSAYELWVLGGGPFAEALVVQAVRNWWGSRTRPPLEIRLFDDNADAAVERIRVRWPEVRAAGSLHAENGPSDAALDFDRAGRPPPHGVFVLVNDEERSLHLGLRLLEEMDDSRVAIAATRRYPPADADPRVEYFDSVEFGLASDAFMVDTFELLGRTIHQHSVLRTRVKPDHSIDYDDDEFGPGHEWIDLHPIWQQSSRAAARAIVPTLHSIGYGIVRLGTNGTTPATMPTFTRHQLDTMAEHEHERWRSFMLAHEWRPGTPRDNKRQLHPGLVPWTKASHEDQKKTREQVADYPYLLALIGFAVVPIPGSTTDA